ncbi:MAG: hypothetical protein M3133_06985, partial [Actinomycetota bacterium]|nr:hypothetical protein [Actinomycetota bacterium]
MSESTLARAWPAELDDVASVVLHRAEANRARLEELVRIPSISAAGHDPAQVRRCAEATAAILGEAGLEQVRLLELDGTHPAVYGESLHAGASIPTVLL